MIKTHAPGGPPRGTHPFTAETLSALFAGVFELVHGATSTFPGPFPPAPPALLAVLRRLGA